MRARKREKAKNQRHFRRTNRIPNEFLSLFKIDALLLQEWLCRACVRPKDFGVFGGKLYCYLVLTHVLLVLSMLVYACIIYTYDIYTHTHTYAAHIYVHTYTYTHIYTLSVRMNRVRIWFTL